MTLPPGSGGAPPLAVLVSKMLGALATCESFAVQMNPIRALPGGYDYYGRGGGLAREWGATIEQGFQAERKGTLEVNNPRPALGFGVCSCCLRALAPRGGVGGCRAHRGTPAWRPSAGTTSGTGSSLAAGLAALSSPLKVRLMRTANDATLRWAFGSVPGVGKAATPAIPVCGTQHVAPPCLWWGLAARSVCSRRDLPAIVTRVL